MNSLPQTQRTLSQIMRSNASSHVTYSDLNILCQEIEALTGDYTTTFVNLSAQGTTSATTSITKYGVNVFTTVNSTNYAAILPQPITGKSVKIVNRGLTTLVLYPSNPGGQINMLAINAPAQIPADGKLYEFICIENPLPGAWTWTPPATTQYDSGDITANISGITKVMFAKDAGNIQEASGFNSSSGWAIDGKNKPLTQSGNTPGFEYVSFKEAVLWQGITKVKCYTNLSANGANVDFGLTIGSAGGHYDPVTGVFIQSWDLAAGNYGSVTSGNFGNCNQTIPGATLAVGALTTNIGDLGTCWGEFTIIGGAGPLTSFVGDQFIGNIANPGVPPPLTIDRWVSSYIGFGIMPRQVLAGLKFRYFIEHY